MMVAPKKEEATATRLRVVVLVSCCTLVCAAAQILMKIGVARVIQMDPIALASNIPLVSGYILYGIFCLMMILSSRLQRHTYA